MPEKKRNGFETSVEQVTKRRRGDRTVSKKRYRTYYKDLMPGAYLTVKEKAFLAVYEAEDRHCDVAQKRGVSVRTVEAVVRRIRKRFHYGATKVELMRLRHVIFLEDVSQNRSDFEVTQSMTRFTLNAGSLSPCKIK